MGMRHLLPKPSLFDCKRVLCIQPHPDDIDIAWGGTVARLGDAGIEVFYLSVTDDAAGLSGEQARLPYSERARLRREEQEAAAEILGVSDLFWLDYPDAGDWSVYDARNAMVDVIRGLSPDGVVTVDPWLPYEAHGDHRKSGFAASEAVILSRFPAVGEAPVPEGLEISAMVFVFTNSCNTTVDTSLYRDRKTRAIAAHSSQFDAATLTELIEIDRVRSEELGTLIGATYAEGCKVLNPGALHVLPEAGDL